MVAEERENHVGLDLGEPFIRRAEVFRAVADGNFVAGDREVAEHQIVLREGGVDERLEVAIVLIRSASALR